MADDLDPPFRFLATDIHLLGLKIQLILTALQRVPSSEDIDLLRRRIGRIQVRVDIVKKWATEDRVSRVWAERRIAGYEADLVWARGRIARLEQRRGGSR